LISAEKRQQLQKKAVKMQIDLNTNTLNKIDSLRDSHRKIAMQEFEEWRTNAEKPILQDISGKVQKNRKAYRYIHFISESIYRKKYYFLRKYFVDFIFN
jgi:hypothetical protein